LAVDQRTFAKSDIMGAEQQIEDLLSTINDFLFERFVADSHCRWCAHNELPCAATSPDTDELDWISPEPVKKIVGHCFGFSE